MQKKRSYEVLLETVSDAKLFQQDGQFVALVRDAVSELMTRDFKADPLSGDEKDAALEALRFTRDGLAADLNRTYEAYVRAYMGSRVLAHRLYVQKAEKYLCMIDICNDWDDFLWGERKVRRLARLRALEARARELAAQVLKWEDDEKAG